MVALPKFARPAMLMLALAGLSASTLAIAQDSKQPAKKAKDVDGKVVINQGKDGKYRFSIYSGKKYMGGQSNFVGYATFDEAAEAFEEFKLVVNAAGKPVVGKKSESGAKEMKEPKKSKKGDK